MIRYAYDKVAVTAAIKQSDSKWFEKAEKRTGDFVKLGRFKEKSSIWSKTKPAFIVLQKNKCVFCERQFENPEYGTIEFDVDHFRPKSSISPWPSPSKHPKLKYNFETGLEEAAGYYWLAYEILNYAASCKICNTIFKLNYFPIAGPRATFAGGSAALAAERAMLCYPIGKDDDDPEQLVTFVATTAVPAKTDGHDARRGRIIIDFFGLNEREMLHKQRATMITLFGDAVVAVARGHGSPSQRELVGCMDQPELPHAACLRAFKTLGSSDPDKAESILALCRDYAIGKSAGAPPAL